MEHDDSTRELVAREAPLLEDHPGAALLFVQCWGANDGQIGDGTFVQRDLPVPVQNGEGAQAIAAGDVSTCAVLEGGVWCWGSNENGGLGEPADDQMIPEPRRVDGLESGTTAVATNRGACAIVDGGLACWGHYPGNGTAVADTPVRLSSPLATGVQTIASSFSHACAIAEGRVYC